MVNHMRLAAQRRDYSHADPKRSHNIVPGQQYRRVEAATEVFHHALGSRVYTPSAGSPGVRPTTIAFPHEKLNSISERLSTSTEIRLEPSVAGIKANDIPSITFW